MLMRYHALHYYPPLRNINGTDYIYGILYFLAYCVLFAALVGLLLRNR